MRPLSSRIVSLHAVLFGLVLAAATGCDDNPAQPSPPPAVLRVNSVTPPTAPAGQATAIRVNGTGFVSGATLLLDNVVTPSTFVSSNSITATAPAHAAGAIDVAVVNPDGQASRLERGFTYVLSVTSLAVSGNLNLSFVGETSQLTAIAGFSDGTTRDVTPEARWESSSPEIATFTQTGLLTARALGRASLAVRYPLINPTQARFFDAFITPPGTFVAFGRVREPGAGGVSGARVFHVSTGSAILTPASGVYSMGGITDNRLSVTKDGFEPVEVIASFTDSDDVPLQRVTRAEAGGAAVTDVLAPNDVEYHVQADTVCQPCRMIRVTSPSSTVARFRITWTELQSTLNLWVDGQMFPPTGTREIIANVPLSAGAEQQVYVGKIRGPIGNYVTFTITVSLQNPEP